MATDSNTGNGTAKPGDKGTTDAEQPSYVTADMVSEIVNKAIGSRNKSFEDKMGKLLDERFTTLTERLTATPTTTKDDAATKGKSKEDRQEDPAVAERVAKLEKQLHDAQARAAKVEMASRDERAHAAIISKLVDPNGVFRGMTPARAEVLARDMRRPNGEVEYDENGGGLRFKLGEENFDLDEGLKRWAKTPTGKEWSPPVPGAGSGARTAPTMVPSPSGGTMDISKLSQKDQGDLLMDSVREAMGGRF